MRVPAWRADGYVSATVGALLGSSLGVGWLTYSVHDVSLHPHTFDNFRHLPLDLAALVVIVVGAPIGCAVALGRRGDPAPARTAALVPVVGAVVIGACSWFAWTTGQRAAAPWNLVEFLLAIIATVVAARRIALGSR